MAVRLLSKLCDCPMPPYRPLVERFQEKVLKNPNPEGCWLWTGAVNEKGYGKIGDGPQRTRRAHRVSWELHIGVIPFGRMVCHTCDTPSCVNPSHLFLGTGKDNSQDMVCKGRGILPDNRGERATWHKLPESAVFDIRTRRLSARKFAALYGVSRSAVFRIWEGKNWKHLDAQNPAP